MNRFLPSMTKTDNDCDADVALLEPTLAPKNPPMSAIIMHNDDYTTMEFVVWVLMSVLRLDEKTALIRMLEIHQQGRACVAILPHEIAQSKVEKIKHLAENEEFPLMVTLESK